MLERIEQIQGVGLFNDAQAKPYKFQKATLIYADNGRGKSTLASIFRSIATNNSGLIIERATIDGALPPKVVMQFDSGHKISYNNGTWSEQRPELLVFDSDFIEKNVHSGGSVSTTHRKNLLEFALGEQAVAARKLVETETDAAKTASDRLNSITAKLSGFHSGIPLSTFEKLGKVDNADVQTQALRKRMADTAGIEALLKKPVPNTIEEPTLNFDSLFSILFSTVESIQDDADRIVREHIAKLGHGDAEHWLSQGLAFHRNDSCPYCDQSIRDVAIVQAYKTHFNARYVEIKKNVAQLHSGIAARTSADIAKQFALKVETANAIADTWRAHLSLPSISFDTDIAALALTELNTLLSKLADVKRLNPTEAAGTNADRARAELLWKQSLDEIKKANASIQACCDSINAFKTKLKTEDAQQLGVQIRYIELSVKRYSQEVIDLFSQLDDARQLSQGAEKRKKQARETLDSLMIATLQKYEKSINKLLTNFGASFKIHKMDANFRGGGPRSEYGLILRNKVISLDGSKPSFATALSEGDKRTLAFAFFIASVLSDPKIESRIVIIDDPMCSLDINRKQHTRAVLKEIHDKSEQIIVLCHDLYFLRDMRDTLSVDGKPAPIALQLAHTAGDYTDFSTLDISRECESPYYRHHRMLTELVNGMPNLDQRAAAKAIRLLLEGYLHRRFPGHIPERHMFGQIVCLIRDAASPSPLVYAQSLVDELNSVNSYAGQFHHDTNPGNADTVMVVPSELRIFAKRALNIVHSGTPLVEEE